MAEPEELDQKLVDLRMQHRDLDDVIATVVADGPYDHLQMQRLKKRKLAIKDQIIRLESILLPNIIA